MKPPFDAFFLAADPGRPGQRFCIFHAAHAPHAAAPRGAVLYVHPFAEEMNKSRRMAALQARAFAAAGFAVLQIDLHGCGDSSGDFGDAGWSGWVADVVQGARWLTERVNAPLWLWGLRAGTLLAAEAAAQLEEPCRLLCWQPVVQGKLTLQQFLRLQSAREMLSGENKGTGDALRRELDEGRRIEVAGYCLAPELARGLAAASLKAPPKAGTAVWIELAAKADAEPTPVLRAAAERWRDAGWTVQPQVLAGPAFWQTSEIETVPALVELTTSLLVQHTVPMHDAQAVAA